MARKIHSYLLLFVSFPLLFIACAVDPGEIAGECGLAPVAIPTLPAFIPGEFELDPSTNLHKSGDPQILELDTYVLKVTGLVETPLSLTFDQLRCMPKITETPTLVCPQTFIDKAQWSGVRMANILKLAGIKEEATHIRMHGADGYYANVTLENAMRPESYLAYEWEGEPLPIMHGFPLRAVIPGQNGSQWVKWLEEIEVW